MAVNDSYRSGDERREIATFFECSYWRNSGVAEYLKKGDVVQVFGRVGVRAYVTKDGEAAAALTFRVSEVKLFGASQKHAKGVEVLPEQVPSAMEQARGEVGTGDLPF